MTHTPGPWRTYRYGDAFTVGTPEGERIADNLERGRDNGEANARLIAAAPEVTDAGRALFIAVGEAMADGTIDAGDISAVINEYHMLRLALGKTYGRELRGYEDLADEEPNVSGTDSK